MPNYQNGKIYKLTCDKSDKIYIGSTTQKLNERLCSHKTLDCNSKELLELGEVKIELIENYSCNSKKELETKERYYIEKYKDIVINKRIPTRTMKEYYQANKNKKLEYQKDYYQNNKECCKEYHQNYYKNNKEKKAQQQKQYRQANKDIISEKKKIKMTCDCGSVLRKDDFSRHYRTKKHQSFLNNKV
tara:strand:+ start:289 stop:852 length:564 start_codon:yes stop_codon:yes gene_type:complete